jgi:hypothetical protein
MADRMLSLLPDGIAASWKFGMGRRLFNQAVIFFAVYFAFYSETFGLRTHDVVLKEVFLAIEVGRAINPAVVYK